MRAADHQVLQEILQAYGDFGHRQHLELAWNYLDRYSIEEAADAMVAAIQAVARLHGAEHRYHETMTRAWLHFVAVHRQRWGAASFSEFAKRNAALFDSRLIEHFYSRELIFSAAARASWAPPDLRPLPALA
jgi:N-formylglutamate deformylase